MKLGDTVTATAVYKRRTRIGRDTDEKYWSVTPITPRAGLYIGTRTLSNGVRWWEHEVGNVYKPKAYFRAALVVFSERESPVFVPLDAMKGQGHDPA